MSDQEFEDCLRQCLAKNKEIISELNELKEEMKGYREKCNVVKTVGTTASTLGTGVIVGSLLAAPFTGGLSLFAAGVGLAASATGSITNVVTDVVDTRKTSAIIIKINSLVDSKKGLNEKFEKLVKEIMEKQEELLKRDDLCKDMNSVRTSGATRVISMACGATNFVNYFKKADTLFFAAPKALSAMAMGGKVAGQTAVKLVGKATVGLSVVSSAIDIAFLVRDWTTNHPTVEVIDNVTAQLETENQTFRQLQAEMERCRTETQQEEEEKKKKCTCRPVQLKVFYLNARSVNPNNNQVNFRSKLQEISQLIQTHQPNIVVIVESWLKEAHDKYQVQAQLGLSGYKIFRQDREMDNLNNAYTTDDAIPNPYRERGGGGIMVAYRPPSQYPRTEFSRDENEDYGDNVVTFNLRRRYNCRKCYAGNSVTINFTAAYRRPKKFEDEADEHFEEINRDVINRIHHIANLSYPDDLLGHDGYCLVGDINRDFRGGDDISDYLQDPSQCLSFDLNGTHQSGRTLDHVFAFPPSMITDLRKTEIISDHSALIFTINLPDDYRDGGNCEECNS